MKNFLKENWFKVITGISMILLSGGFFINSITPLKAETYKPNLGTYKVGDLHMTGCGIDSNYAYLVSYQVNEENNDYYYKIPLSRFKLLSSK